MLFNSPEFIFGFLPITLLIFFWIGSLNHFRLARLWLFAASLFFYGWWNPPYLSLILGSIFVNYTLASMISREGPASSFGASGSVILGLGIVLNLGLLGYYKYFNWFLFNINNIGDNNFAFPSIFLPLAISFFTLQQISYLIDSYKRKTHAYTFSDYGLYVSFFPQLLAGPIVRHDEMFPQFGKPSLYKFNADNLAVGLTVFFIGLFKKSVIADGIAEYATPVFEAADVGMSVTFFEAWGGALAYTFQLYFDFSGYSDMAIGIAAMFGLRLPLNFYSPYKSKNIIEFWRRWHITLSRFFRDYLYVPLGGNRKGQFRQYWHLMITMVVGGLWHGAGWNFLIWGGLHGSYIALNHGWQRIRVLWGHDLQCETPLGRFCGQSFTFLAIVLAWVFFRATTLSGAVQMIKGMTGLHGAVLDERLASWVSPLGAVVAFEGHGIGTFGSCWGIVWLIGLFVIACWAPNTYQILSNFKPWISSNVEEAADLGSRWIKWDLTPRWAFVMTLLSVVALYSLSGGVHEFLYYQF